MNRYYTILLGIIVLLLLASCSVYYNTFFNIEKYYDSAQKRPLSAQGRPNAQAIQEYNKVIEKCAFIINEYPKSKWVPGAVYYMGQAFYFRGNSQLQALEKFEELVQFYPDSKFTTDGIMALARVKYDLGRKDEAFDMLRSFIQNPEQQQDHPKVLVQIADLFLLDKNFLEAQFYLAMLIERFPKSDKYADAHILLGKSYFDNKNYAKSLETFQAVASIKASKSDKNDAVYYVAYNLFYLKDYDTAERTIRALIKKEIKEEKINEYNVLLARIMSETDRVSEALEMLEAVATKVPRSLLAAEAVFYIAEINFMKQSRYDLAIENYNRVRRENQNSPHIERATARSGMASQMLQYYQRNTEMPATQLIQEQIKLAQYYLYELANPDSALVIYSRIPHQAIALLDKIDTLRVEIREYEERQARLVAINAIATGSDSTMVMLADSDSLRSTIAVALADTTSAEPAVDIEALRAKLITVEDDFILYIDEYIPQSYLVSMVICRQFFENEERVRHYYDLINREYPDSRYAESAREFFYGERVTNLTREEKRQLARYEYAMGYYGLNTKPSSDTLSYIASILDSLTSSVIVDLRDKSRYTLGFIHYFDMGDSLTAKTYLDTLLKYAPTGEYATATKKFYDGEKFLKEDRLPLIVERERQRAEEARLALEAQAAAADSAAIASSLLADSTAVSPDLVADSTQAISTDSDSAIALSPPVITPPIVPPPPVLAPAIPVPAPVSTSEAKPSASETTPVAEETPLVSAPEPVAKSTPEPVSEPVATSEPTVVAPAPATVAPTSIPETVTSTTTTVKTSHSVRQGDYLRRIAEEVYGDEMKWVIIYRANRDKIIHPDIIHPDIELVIPILE